MYPPFLPFVHRLLSARKEPPVINFVDIGSRNGIIELASLAPFVNAYGFEPNPEEFEKLVSGKTDAAKVGIRMPRYKSVQYSPYAVADTNGKKPLYITRGAGAVGMKEPDPERLKEIHWKGALYPHNFAEDIFTVERIVEVPVQTLQDFAREKSLSYIDYLKIDVEGSEYEVLSGAGDLLKNVGVIKVEVCFIPFRKEQKLFSEVDLLLRRHGFDLLKYEISPLQVGLKERTESWSFGPSVGFPERFGQPLQADAVYVNRSITNRDRALAQGLVLLEKNYLDEALFVLRTKAGIEDAHLLNLLRTYRGPWRTRLLDGLFRWGRALLKPNPSKWK